MNIHQALEAFTHALTIGADSFTLAAAKADLDAAYRAHVTTLHRAEPEAHHAV